MIKVWLGHESHDHQGEDKTQSLVYHTLSQSYLFRPFIAITFISSFYRSNISRTPLSLVLLSSYLCNSTDIVVASFGYGRHQ